MSAFHGFAKQKDKYFHFYVEILFTDSIETHISYMKVYGIKMKPWQRVGLIDWRIMSLTSRV